MPNLTQLGTNLFLGSIYSVVVYTDENGQTWVSHHTDKSRSYRTDWTAQKVAEAIEGGKTEEARLKEQWSGGQRNGLLTAKQRHNKLPWYKRMRKIE